jgi:predicted DNA-binding transcriptional regulator AlpA
MNSQVLAKVEDKTIGPTVSDDSRLWDANDVARFIGASRSWVYHQAEAGRLPCIRLLGFLRFDPQVVRAFVQAASSAPATVKNRAAVVASPGDIGR